MRPSSQTTIDATVSLPWIVEMSKHSMRRGSAGSASTCCSVSSASYCAVVRLVEARLIGERRVAVREIDEAALLAALRHDDPDACGRRAPTASVSSASRSSGSAGTWISAGAPRSS